MSFGPYTRRGKALLEQTQGMSISLLKELQKMKARGGAIHIITSFLDVVPPYNFKNTVEAIKSCKSARLLTSMNRNLSELRDKKLSQQKAWEFEERVNSLEEKAFERPFMGPYILQKRKIILSFQSRGDMESAYKILNRLETQIVETDGIRTKCLEKLEELHNAGCEYVQGCKPADDIKKQLNERLTPSSARLLVSPLRERICRANQTLKAHEKPLIKDDL